MPLNIFYALFCVFALCSCQTSTNLSQRQLTPDPLIVTGTLGSGLKFSLLPNDSEDLAILLQINTGSLAETDSQQGYAHLVEHLGFQGTKHFSATQIHQLYTSAGMKLGPDINAFTHFNTTQFVITLSQDNTDQNTVTPFIKWLADIARGDFKIDPNKLAIEKEIVLAEEIRQKQNPKPHFFDSFDQHLLQGSKLSNRRPIGKPAIIKEAGISNIEEFIDQHYHLANSTLVIIGKGAHKYQTLIENNFNTERVAINVHTLPNPPVTLNTSHFFFSKDYADEFSQLVLYHPRLDQSKTLAKQNQFLTHLFKDVIYNRLRRASTNAPLPFTNISVDSLWLYDQENSTIMVRHNNSQHSAAIGVITTELNRLAQFGLIESEFLQLQRNWRDELSFKKPAPARNEIFVLAKTHLENIPYTGFAADKSLAESTLGQLSLQSFNQKLAQWLSQSSQQWTFSGTALPARKLETKIDNAKGQFVLPPTEQKLPSLPVVTTPPGSIIDEITHSSAGITQWTLSNGIKVIMQPRPSDSVAMLFIGPGGFSSVIKKNYPAAVMAAAVYSRSGQNWIADTDLEKLLIDNKIDLHSVMQAGFQGLEVKASPEKLPLAFALMHSSMNNAVVKKSTFDAIQQNYVSQQKKADQQPVNQYSRQLSKARLSDSQDYLMPTAAQFQTVTIKQLEALYAEKYQNAQGYVLAISGNFSIAEIRPLLEKHIATLNTQDMNSTNLDLRSNQLFVHPSSTLVSNPLKGAQKSHLNYAFFSPAKKISIKERFKLVILSIALREILFKQLREEQGLVYDVSVPMQYSDKTLAYHFLSIMAVSAPAKVKTVMQSITTSIAHLRANGITQTQLEQAKQSFHKGFKTSLEDDYTLTYIMASNALIDLDYLQVINYEKLLEQIDTIEINQAIAQYLSEKGKHVGIFYQ